MGNLFSGKMTIVVELDCQDTDADLLAASLQSALDARLEASLEVMDYSIQVEKFSS